MYTLKPCHNSAIIRLKISSHFSSIEIYVTKHKMLCHLLTRLHDQNDGDASWWSTLNINSLLELEFYGNNKISSTIFDSCHISAKRSTAPKRSFNYYRTKIFFITTTVNLFWVEMCVVEIQHASKISPIISLSIFCLMSQYSMDDLVSKVSFTRPKLQDDFAVRFAMKKAHK